MESNTEKSSQSKRVYVGNLPFKTTNEELNDTFEEKFGSVKKATILRKYNRSQGCGIVEFETEEAADKAKNLKEMEMDGRKVFIREDRETSVRTNKAPFRRNRGRFQRKFRTTPSSSTSGGPPPKNNGDFTSVFIGNLSFNATEEDVKGLASKYGKVQEVVLPTKKDFKRGYAIVRFTTSDEAQKFIDGQNGESFMERTVRVRFDKYVPEDEE